MQFTRPFIEDAVAAARDDDVDLLVGLPVYPLCGRSTTVAALDSLARALQETGWEVSTSHVSGWHRHPGYLDLRAASIRRHCRDHGVDLMDPGVLLVFSAHGTPIRYLEGANRYDEYVREYCLAVAERLGGPPWELGFQNHGNRPVEWTQPEVDRVVEEADADTVVVDAMSFMHEQSETLSELDLELREVAEGEGREFHRVPIPHDDPTFIEVLADLVVLAARRGRAAPAAGSIVYEPPVRGCACRPTGDTVCLNVEDS
jgi:ferrochelatase